MRNDFDFTFGVEHKHHCKIIKKKKDFETRKHSNSGYGKQIQNLALKGKSFFLINSGKLVQCDCEYDSAKYSKGKVISARGIVTESYALVGSRKDVSKIPGASVTVQELLDLENKWAKQNARKKTKTKQMYKKTRTQKKKPFKKHTSKKKAIKKKSKKRGLSVQYGGFRFRLLQIYDPEHKMHIHLKGKRSLNTVSRENLNKSKGFITD